MARTASKLYVPLDVGFFDDSKIVAAGEKAAWLYLNMMTKAKLLDSDGLLTRGQIAKLGVPGWQTRLAALIEHEAVVELPMAPGTFALPSWEKWNETSEHRQERLKKQREAKAAKAAEEKGASDAT